MTSMKYLFIDMRDGGDWSLDLMFAGFVKLLGPKNVFDFPNKKKHREWTKDSKPEWGLERRTLGYTEYNSLVSSSFSDITTNALNGNLTVVLDERIESFLMYEKLGLYRLKTPVIVIAGHDEFWLQGGIPKLKEMYGERLLHTFIDNVISEDQLVDDVSLINLSANFAHYWEKPNIVEKETDICFFGSMSSKDRVRFVNHVLKNYSHLNLDIFLDNGRNGTDCFLSKAEYFSRMAKSKICLNIGGAAYGRAFRFYEIPWSGSFMLSQSFEAKQLNPFIDGEHCCYFSDEQKLDELITKMLSNDFEREKIAKQGREFLIDFHSCESRAKYVLDTVGAKNG